MTYYELRKNILLKLDEYDSDFDKAEQHYLMTDDTDILTKMPYAINEAIRFAFYGKNYKEKWHITQGFSFNALTETEAEHRNEEIIYEAEHGYGYYFEVDDDATINIYTSTDGGTSWQIVKSIEAKTKDDTLRNMSYKGIVGDGNKMRIVFGGDYYYRIHNVCIYNVKFSSANKAPDFNGFHTHSIPENLYKIERVYLLDRVHKDGNLVQEKVPIEFIVKGDLLYLPDIEGEFEIESSFFPKLVTESTDAELAEIKDSFELQIPKDTEFVVVQKACAFLSQDGEYEEFVSDSEQGMQMLDTNRGSSAPTVKRFW